MVTALLRILTCVIIVTALHMSSAALAQTSSAKQTIKLTLDASEIYLGDTVVMEVESTGLLDPIDFTPLLEQATMVRETSGTRIAVIGGKVVEIELLRIDLIPKRVGIIVIGPLAAGKTISNSVFVKILDTPRPDWKPQQTDLQIKTSLLPDSVWINQQVKLTIELLHRYPISNESISLPALDDFTTRDSIIERRTFKGTNREWFRTEWQYFIFPNRSGTLTLGDIKWTGSIAKSRIERADFSRSVQSLSLAVNPASDDRGHWWLPSKDLNLTATWSKPPTELRAGDELERTITLRAIGVVAGQLPTPEVPESRAIQQTLISSTRNETLSDNGVISTAEFTYRVKAQSPIPVFLDTIRIPWWDTTKKQPKDAIIPARRINVGLPDRADVLSKIAMQETGINRLKHWLQTTNQLRFFIYSLGAISLVFLLMLCTPITIKQIRHRERLQHLLHTLRSSAYRCDAKDLYQRLKQPESKELLQGAESNLVCLLEKNLFSPKRPQTALRLIPMLKALEKTLKVQSKSHTRQRRINKQRALVDL